MRDAKLEAITRRGMLAGSCAFAGLLMIGCSRDETGGNQESSAPDAKSGAARRTMIVHKDPNCGCCKSWADIAQRAGYDVQVFNEADMASVKARLGVPEELASCHTAEIAGLTVEGHVPIEAVERMLRQHPQGLRGIAVPGMPAGSPGMEMPDGRREPFQVIAFFADGRTSVFAGLVTNDRSA